MSKQFNDLGVPRAITDALAARSIDQPFPIQTLTIPDALQGRDVCGRADTGSGKTLAFGIPLVALVPKADPRRPTGLVLVPTRELAAQVRREIAWLGESKRVRVTAIYGGVGFEPQRKALRKGVDVIVACPGRLADLVQRGDVRLDRVTFVVVDEADRMADMGFLPEVRRLLDQVHPDRQTLLFSATLDGAVGTLVERYQRRPARHGVARDEDLPVNRHVLWRAERDTRVSVTAQVVAAHWPAIVFSRTKHGADRLVRQLGKLGVAAEAIHGNRSQSQRERALRNFTTSRAQALVATDVAARGIHVDGVACVVHFDAPPDPKDFVHRSGRTGRAGAEGLVVTLTPAADVRVVTKMMRQAGVEIDATTPDVPALGNGTAAPSRPAPIPEPTSTERAPRQKAGGHAGRGRGTQGSNGDGRRRDDDRPARVDGGPGGRRRPRKGGRGDQGRLGLDGERRGEGTGRTGRSEGRTSAGSGRADGASRSGRGQGGGGAPKWSGGSARPGGGRSGGSPGGGRSGGGARSGRR